MYNTAPGMTASGLTTVNMCTHVKEHVPKAATATDHKGKASESHPLTVTTARTHLISVSCVMFS